MTKLKNLVYLGIFGGALLLLKYYVVDPIFTTAPKDSSIWFTSGLLLVVLGIFVTEKYFTRSLDVLVNVITLLVVLFTLDRPNDFQLWSALLTYTCIVGVLALASFLLYDEEKNHSVWSQRIAGGASNVARFLGSSRMLFSIVFILSIFNYFVSSIETATEITQAQLAILSLIVFWGMALMIEPIDRKLIQPTLEMFTRKTRQQLLGQVARRMSPNIVVAEIFPSGPRLEPGELVDLGSKNLAFNEIGTHPLCYLFSQDSENKCYGFFYALTPDTVRVDKQRFLHSLSAQKKQEIAATLTDNDFIKNKENLVGFVHPGSDIEVLKVKMIEGVDEENKMREGDLLSVTFYGQPTKYQIINVETAVESVEGASKHGGKIITAQQIGSWRSEKQRFEGTGWVPEVNAPVFRETRDEEVAELGGEHYRVGTVPGSKYPIYIDLEESVTHHIAVIGKTGTGKSRMSAKMIEHLAGCGYRVVVLEIDQKNPQSLAKRIAPALVSAEQTAWTSAQKTKQVSGRTVTYTEWTARTNMEAADGKRVFVVNWDNNTKTQDDGPQNQTEGAIAVITDVVRYQQEHPDQKVCIVLEEAYDFIPESTFGQQDFGQPGVSRISQLVLKCRKHNIGFFVITQRTALVSKTILNQCQTILALQSFDETTRNFMGSYINQSYLDSMSILRRFHAIVVGKGSTCDKPVIVDFYQKNAVNEHATPAAPVAETEVTAATTGGSTQMPDQAR